MPSPDYLPTIHTLVYSLDAFVWLLIFVIIFPFSLLARCVVSNHPFEPNFHSFELLELIRCYLNQTFARLPRTTNLRSIIFMWIVYCFLITNIFQSCLTSTLTVKRLEHEINTIADLSESDLRIIAAIDYARLIVRYFNQSWGGANRQKLTAKLWPMEWFEYNQFIGNNNIQYAYANKHHMTTYYANVKMKSGFPLFHMMHECPVPFPACYIVPFGSPLLGQLNTIIGRLEHGGIFQYWERRAGSDDFRARLTRSDGQPEPLRLNSLFAFYFLFGGLFIAFITLLYELKVWQKVRVLLNRNQ